MSDRDFDALRHVAEESVLGRLIGAVTGTLERSWLDSRSARAVSTISNAIGAMSVATRIRLCAMTIAWAAIGYTLSLFVAPPYVRSAMPAPVFAGVAVIALIVASGAGAFATAWEQSSLRAALRK